MRVGGQKQENVTQIQELFTGYVPRVLSVGYDGIKKKKKKKTFERLLKTAIQ